MSMYSNVSNNENFPKTLIIRNHLGGAIWQVYHVQKLSEAEKLSFNATMNGFEAITLEDYQKIWKRLGLIGERPVIQIY